MATTSELIQELLKGELDAEERKLGEHVLSVGKVDDEAKHVIAESFDSLSKTVNDYMDSIHDVISRFAITALLCDFTFVAGAGSLGEVDHVVKGGKPQTIVEIITRLLSES